MNEASSTAEVSNDTEENGAETAVFDDSPEPHSTSEGANPRKIASAKCGCDWCAATIPGARPRTTSHTGPWQARWRDTNGVRRATSKPSYREALALLRSVRTEHRNRRGRRMTGPEHYREAERLVSAAMHLDGELPLGKPSHPEAAEHYLKAATVHALLAVAGGVGLGGSMNMPGADAEEWELAAATDAPTTKES